MQSWLLSLDSPLWRDAPHVNSSWQLRCERLSTGEQEGRAAFWWTAGGMRSLAAPCWTAANSWAGGSAADCLWSERKAVPCSDSWQPRWLTAASTTACPCSCLLDSWRPWWRGTRTLQQPWRRSGFPSGSIPGSAERSRNSTWQTMLIIISDQLRNKFLPLNFTPSPASPTSK